MERIDKDGNISKKGRLICALFGALTGFINGFFGGGGGMVIVPVLTDVIGQETKKAHATAIAVILPITIVSVIVYSAVGTPAIKTALPVTTGAIIGGGLGAVLLGKLKDNVLKWIFAVMMLTAGVKLAFF